VVLKGLTGTIEAALRATFAITNRLMTAQSRALAAHRAVLECIRVRDADGARAATIDLLGFAARDLKNKSIDAGERPEPKWKPQTVRATT
jgi:GntR family transcriptional regulator, galactonate operon transcriptional repressor